MNVTFSSRTQHDGKGLFMKKFAVAAVAALALSATPVSAADLITKAKPMAAPPAPPAWDLAFGGAIASDYVWRGITQSAHEASVASYFEPRYNVSSALQLYAGVGGASIKFPNGAAAEIDFYGGIRPTVGKLALDFGIWYYYYPGGESTYTTLYLGTFTAFSDASFYEGYARASYPITDNVTVGANLYYTPSYLNTGADGTYYSGTIKVTAPANMLPNGMGAYASAEIGRQELGTTKADGYVYSSPVDLASYTTWNLGVGLTWKVFTLDLRYTDTDLSEVDCGVITGDPHMSALGEFKLVRRAFRRPALGRPDGQRQREVIAHSPIPSRAAATRLPPVLFAAARPSRRRPGCCIVESHDQSDSVARHPGRRGRWRYRDRDHGNLFRPRPFSSGGDPVRHLDRPGAGLAMVGPCAAARADRRSSGGDLRRPGGG